MEYLKPTSKKVNPEQNTNFLSRFLFTYSKNILVTGFRKELTQNDIYEVLPAYESKKLGNKLEVEWKKLFSSKKASVLRLMFKCFGKEYLLILFSLIIPITTGALQPKLIKRLISCFTKRETMNKNEAYFNGFALALVLFVQSVYTQNFFLRTHTFALKMRVGFTSLIFRQVLAKNSLDISVGKTVTLITKDVNEFENIFHISCLVRDSVVCSMVFYVLYTEIGWLFLILVFIILLIVLPDSYLAIWVKSMKTKALKKTEERYQQTKEVLSSIKLVKLYLWEEKYGDKICKLRQQEVRLIARILKWSWIKNIFADFILTISWYCVLVTCIYFGLQLNPGTLFLIMQSISVITRTVQVSLPVVFHKIATLAVVIKRIEKFLQSGSSSYDQHLGPVPKITASNLKVLQERLDFTITEGLTIITGPNGSGKSTLLKIIAEHGPMEDDLKVIGSLSYASQEPWLFPSTIRQNILFGANYEEQRYLEVLKVCALTYDLENLKEGDNSLVVDRGGNLSKGQQIRINLARAVYKNCDIYLLDDCLSSLDVLTADVIFKNCVKFLEGKIVVLSSTNLKYVAAADNVVSLSERKEFVRRGLAPDSIVSRERVCGTDSESDEADEDSSLLPRGQTRRLYGESKNIGQVSWKTYKAYFAFGGYLFIFLVFLLAFPMQFLRGTISKLESKWINAEQIIIRNSTIPEKYVEALQTRYQLTYTLPIVVLTMTLTDLVKINMFWTFVAKASINIHKLLFKKMTKVTMKFFDTHLIGTILNRFSEDLLYIDEAVSSSLIRSIRMVSAIIGNIIVIATVSPWLLLPIFLSLIFLIFVRKFYLKSGRVLKRLEFASRSPLLGAINATIEGLTTVRVFKQQKILQEEFDRNLDLHTSCSYVYLTTTEAFYFFLEFWGICFFLFVVVTLLMYETVGPSVGDVGLLLIQTLRFCTLQHYLFRTWTELENDMITVKRILKYTKQEEERSEGFVVEKWPPNGQIEYQNVYFSYNSDTWDLNNLNFCIHSKEKLAVIGRTGSGKTSLMYSLLRLYGFKGKITIDDIDITTLSLDFFRSKISVVPQDPALFTGSLRDNVDPIGKYTDEEIWATIQTVKLSSVFQSLDEKISSDSNLSLGHKQLICLCRALIRKNKIVVIDEVTASVDDEVETMIHEIIDEHFADSTVVMITHKLRYILNYDKVLLLEKGEVVEFGSPFSLLEDVNSVFYKMYNAHNL